MFSDVSNPLFDVKDKADLGWVGVVNNVDSAPDEIDLHGLFVKEAIDFADQALVDAKRRGAPQLRIIVGKVRLCLIKAMKGAYVRLRI